MRKRKKCKICDGKLIYPDDKAMGFHQTCYTDKVLKDKKDDHYKALGDMYDS